MADTAKEDFDLNVTFARITPGDRGGGKLRFRTCSSVSLPLLNDYYVSYEVLDIVVSFYSQIQLLCGISVTAKTS
ncbi:MAG: hypothetical protein WAK17_05445 [Candidatus Nitrosopolaris sp.]